MPEIKPPDLLAGHVQESVEVVAAFRMDGPTSRLQRITDRTTDLIARPMLVVIMLCLMALWIAGNLAARDRAIDASPFGLLELAATLGSLLIALLILATQRREDRLAERRVLRQLGHRRGRCPRRRRRPRCR